MHAKIEKIHTSYKVLATGDVAIYAYVPRGGPLLCKAVGRDKNEARIELERTLGLPETIGRLAELLSSTPKVTTSSKNISGLIKLFRTSPEFRQLSPSTKSDYDRYLDSFELWFGEWPVRVFEEFDSGRDILEWRDTSAAQNTRTADYMIASVSRLFSWAREHFHTKANPTANIVDLYRSDRSDITWSDEEIGKVLASAATEELRHAIRLASATGLRQGDLLRLPWSAIQGNALVRKTRKRGTTVIIPVEPIRALLDCIPKRSPIILTSSRGRPWTGHGLRSSFDRAKRVAGIEAKHWHDLRGTAATRLYKNGLPVEKIAQWMGWSTSKIQTLIDIYVSYEAVAEDMLKSMNSEQALQTGYKPEES